MSNDDGANDRSIDTYKELFRAFLDGATEGQHRRVEIREEDDRTLLVAYDWALYAERDKQDGVVTFYEAWASGPSGRSTMASCVQAGRLGTVLDEQPVFEQVAKQERVDELPTVDGHSLDQFSVDMQPPL